MRTVINGAGANSTAAAQAYLNSTDSPIFRDLYNIGPPIGSALGIACGASIAAAFSWRYAFVWLGSVGLFAVIGLDVGYLPYPGFPFSGHELPQVSGVLAQGVVP